MTLLVRSVPLRLIDRDICDVLVENMVKLGLDIRLQTPHDSVTKNDDGSLNVNLKNGQSLKCDRCLVALGRPPNVAPLRLDNTDIKVEKNAIVVDEYQNTTVDGVYAIGDVTNQVTLTPVAIRAGRIVSERIFNGRAGLKMCYDNIATVIFSHPPIGTCGMKEEDAIAKFGEENVKTFRSNFTNMFYSPSTDDQKRLKSYFKLVCQQTAEDNGQDWTHLKVVGVHGIGRGIDEMMQAVSIAITMGATK